jgi:CTP:molybdopterin cytidylyltransferase MocA
MYVAAILDASPRADLEGAPLALAPWDGDETLVEYEVRQLRDAGADVVIVVLGYEAERIIPVVARDDIEPIVHAAWQADPAGALRTGASAVPRHTATAILLALSEPRPAPFIASLLQAHARAGAPITLPVAGQRTGAPRIIGAQALAALRNAPSSAAVSRIVEHAAEAHRVETGEPFATARIPTGATAGDLWSLRDALR